MVSKDCALAAAKMAAPKIKQAAQYMARRGPSDMVEAREKSNGQIIKN
jgi:hypothetical protein